MSKYNLTDILEQYKIGSGWTTDFDYDGMLNAGLALNAETDVKTMKKVVEDFTDVNYHREASHLYDAIEALEKGDSMEAQGRLNDFYIEIKQTMKDQGMDTSDDLGAYMASKMEEGEAVDLAIEASQEKAGIKEGFSPEAAKKTVISVKDNPEKLKKFLKNLVGGISRGSMKSIDDLRNVLNAMEEEGIKLDEIAGYDRKGNKQQDTDGSDASKYKRAAMNKEDLQETIGNAKAKIDEGSYPFDQCLSDNEGKYGKKGAAKVCGYIKAQYGEGIVKEEEFSGEDEMQMHLKQYRDGNIDGDDLFQAFDEIINGSVSSPRKRGFNLKYGMEEANAVNFNMKADADYDEGLEDIEEALPKFKGVPPMRDIVKALKDDAKATDSEIKQFMASVKKAGDEFDDIDDYVEDFKNYVADKSLQEHFKRFM